MTRRTSMSVCINDYEIDKHCTVIELGLQAQIRSTSRAWLQDTPGHTFATCKCEEWTIIVGSSIVLMARYSVGIQGYWYTFCSRLLSVTITKPKPRPWTWTLRLHLADIDGISCQRVVVWLAILQIKIVILFSR
jgi:hypothetical protein